MLRRLVLTSMTLSLIFTTIACTSPTLSDSTPINSPSSGSSQVQTAPATRISDGTYPVQQATYNDLEGEYTVMLLETKPGESSMYRSTDLQMARLTDEEIQAGQKAYLRVENGQASLHIPEDFRIEYVHNVTENQTNPQTGQPEVVVVRQEPSFWTPFAGALAGQALGSLLFRPQYYFPPVYQPGIALTGYGGYGRTFNDASRNYQTRYQAPPAAVRNRQLRTTGRLRAPATVNRPAAGSPTQTNRRPTGSGYGNSTLRRSDSPNRTRVNPSNRSFGSSRRRAGGRRR